MAIPTFTLIRKDGQARLGELQTMHGGITTPAFMPVGSQATVKGISPEELTALGAQMILCNAYHLYLRPGHQTIQSIGGLHRFMGWSGAILTDSGGYQIFSLAPLCKVNDDGVTFQSHLDGSLHHVTPELAIEIQESLGSDVAMVLDECLRYPATTEEAEASLRRTNAWAQRCRDARRRPDQAVFGIVQGGHYPDLRARAAAEVARIGFDGYALGGLSVGEDKGLMHGAIEASVAELPESAPRYLMGVGTPEDLLEGVSRGIDLFDCVMPTRHGRTGWLFTSFGRLLIKNAQYAKDESPIDPACSCPVCRKYSRAYLRHLFLAKEMLGVRLNTLHNLHYILQFMRDMREAIREERLAEFRSAFYATRVAYQA
ncbi:MAG TPA: tRNA guanosine(34) transglycosylase Tgt [Nitrospirales bacterium]|jgi:queuine tRNA-ribosyltransferase